MVRLKLEPPRQESEEQEQQYADASTSTGPRLPKDRFARRIGLGVCISLVINVGLWTLLSGVVRSHLIAPPKPITFKLVTLPPPPKHKRIVPPKVKPTQKPVVVPKPIDVLKPNHTPPPPPEHNRILTAQGSTAASNTALPGGNAPVGVPIPVQSPAPTNAAPAPPPPVAAPPPVAPPPPVQAPKAAPPPPAGPTVDAAPISQVSVDIPDELKDQDYKSFVRVKVDVGADGSSVPVLLTSSGDADIDQRVLDALKRWKWKPALQNGVPIASSQRFRFNFVVQ